MSKKQYRSKLQKKAARTADVTRGMGSAVPENQRLAGAEDPEAAARLAGMDQGEIQERIESIERESHALREMAQDIEYAVENEDYEISEDIDLTDKEEVTKEHGILVEWRANKIDSETEQLVEQSFGEDRRISPDDPLYNPVSDRARRRWIESQLEDLDFEQMVFQGYCEQSVPIRENFDVVFRTISTTQGLWVEMDLTDLADYSAQYGRHWFSLVQVSLSVQSVNGKSIGPSLDKLLDPTHRDAFKKALEARMKFIGRMPSIITDDLIVHYTWFSGRVRKLLSGDLVGKVGNF